MKIGAFAAASVPCDPARALANIRVRSAWTLPGTQPHLLRQRRAGRGHRQRGLDGSQPEPSRGSGEPSRRRVEEPADSRDLGDVAGGQRQGRELQSDGTWRRVAPGGRRGAGRQSRFLELAAADRASADARSDGVGEWRSRRHARCAFARRTLRVFTQPREVRTLANTAAGGRRQSAFACTKSVGR